MRVIAVDGGDEKKKLCGDLGAEKYIDFTQEKDITGTESLHPFLIAIKLTECSRVLSKGDGNHDVWRSRSNRVFGVQGGLPGRSYSCKYSLSRLNCIGQLIVRIAAARRNHGGCWPATRYQCYSRIQSVRFGIEEKEYRGQRDRNAQGR